jgi:hypothetical protein
LDDCQTIGGRNLIIKRLNHNSRSPTPVCLSNNISPNRRCIEPIKCDFFWQLTSLQCANWPSVNWVGSRTRHHHSSSSPDSHAHIGRRTCYFFRSTDFSAKRRGRCEWADRFDVVGALRRASCQRSVDVWQSCSGDQRLENVFNQPPRQTSRIASKRSVFLSIPTGSLHRQNIDIGSLFESTD